MRGCDIARPGCGDDVLLPVFPFAEEDHSDDKAGEEGTGEGIDPTERGDGAAVKAECRLRGD